MRGSGVISVSVEWCCATLIRSRRSAYVSVNGSLRGMVSNGACVHNDTSDDEVYVKTNIVCHSRGARRRGDEEEGEEERRRGW